MESVKLGAVTESVAFTVWVNDPLVPVIVNVLLPVGVELATLTVRFDEPVLWFGLKVGVAPAGRPLALNVTGAENPLVGLTFTT